jgi:hypothetical protein
VAEEGGERGDLRRILAHREACGQHRDPALAGIEQQCRQRRAPVAGAQHVRRPDIARTDGAQVAKTQRAGDDKPERDRAQQVGRHGDQQQERGGGIEDRQHQAVSQA